MSKNKIGYTKEFEKNPVYYQKFEWAFRQLIQALISITNPTLSQGFGKYVLSPGQEILREDPLFLEKMIGALEIYWNDSEDLQNASVEKKEFIKKLMVRTKKYFIELAINFEELKQGVKFNSKGENKNE